MIEYKDCEMINYRMKGDKKDIVAGLKVYFWMLVLFMATDHRAEKEVNYDSLGWRSSRSIKGMKENNHKLQPWSRSERSEVPGLVKVTCPSAKGV